MTERYVARRGPLSRRGYNSKAWRHLRRWQLNRQPICQCPRQCGKAASDVDHIEPVSGPGDPLFWDKSNLQSLAHACHSRKTAVEDGGFGHRRKGE